MGWLLAVHVSAPEFGRSPDEPRTRPGNDDRAGCDLAAGNHASQSTLSRAENHDRVTRLCLRHFNGPAEAGAKRIEDHSDLRGEFAADAQKLALAKTFGADYTIDVDNENVVERVREITAGRGADVVVDVSSYATQPVIDALSLVRPGGRVVLAGVKGFKKVEGFVSDLVVLKEIKILGAIGVTASGYRSAIRLLESGRVPIELMHTHNFELAEAELAIRTLAREIPDVESIHSCLIPEH